MAEQLICTITKKGGVFDGKAPAIVREELYAAMYEATMYLERKVKEFTPQGVYGASGGLLSTIHGEVQGMGTPVMKGIVAHGKGDYGDTIELGRRAGKAMPPEGSLIRWIEVKLDMSEASAKQIEFLIRRKIGKKGFPGAHMFEKGLDQGWPTTQKIFDERGFNIARRLN